MIQSNGIFNGWVIDSAGQRVSKAPLPAFKLRRGLNIIGTDSHDVAEGETIDLPNYVKLGIPNFVVSCEQRNRPHGAANTFKVTDDSRVTITSTDSQFKQSLAVNAFASASTESAAVTSLFFVGIPGLLGVSSSWGGSTAVGVGQNLAGTDSILRGSYEVLTTLFFDLRSGLTF